MNQLKKYIGKDGHFRAFVVQTTGIGQELFTRLQPYPISLRIIAEAVTSGLLMAADLKVDGNISIKAFGNGPMRHVTAEANSAGEARGYCGEPHLVLEKQEDSSFFTQAIGEGELTVRKRFAHTEKLYSSIVSLQAGGWAENLTRYYLESEQISSGMRLGVELDAHLGIKGSGGLLIMAMPEADPDILEMLDRNVRALPALGNLFSDDDGHNKLADQLFKGLDVKELESKSVCYRCNCSPLRVLEMLNSLPQDEVQDMKDKAEPISVNCAFCSKTYEFQPENLG